MHTRDLIMTAARTTVQARGYSGLSFRDIATEVGIKSASVHYHFPTKGDLGAALAREYTARANADLDGIATEAGDPATCLRRYTDLFRMALAHDNRMCLCGIMAAEYDDLPDAVKAEVAAFGEANVSWLTKILARLTLPGGPEATGQRALAIFAAVGGAQLAARSRNDISVYDRIVDTYRTSGLIPR